MKKKSKASPIILAVLCAVGVHTILFTDAGHRMQGAITEASTEASDSSLILNGDTISLVLQKNITQAKKITASILYDNTSITLSKPESTMGNITSTNEDFSDNITLNISTPKDIMKGTVLATWKVTKVLPQIHTVNLSDVQVESTDGIVSLSTRGTGEF